METVLNRFHAQMTAIAAPFQTFAMNAPTQLKSQAQSMDNASLAISMDVRRAGAMETVPNAHRQISSQPTTARVVSSAMSATVSNVTPKTIALFANSDTIVTDTGATKDDLSDLNLSLLSFLYPYFSRYDIFSILSSNVDSIILY